MKDMKTIKAVAPYIYPNGINFKNKPYEAWVKCGGQIADAHYPPRLLHGLTYRWELPRLWKSKKEARLRFVQPWSMRFDTFPDYAFYEIIPFFWDVWPANFENTVSWLKKHEVRTAIFTSSQVVEMIKTRFPHMNVLHCHEGIDVEGYSKGKALKDRGTDFLEYGREIDHIVKYDFSEINHVQGKKDGIPIFTKDELREHLADAKIVAAYPKSWTNPEEAGGIETLTQRYWECMLSRCVMIGHAPKELVDLIGYNPVVDVDRDKPTEQLQEVLGHIDDYQELVDRNREAALKFGTWTYGTERLMNYLKENVYEI